MEENQKKCPQCGSYIDTSDLENGDVQQCENCETALLMKNNELEVIEEE